MTGIAAAAVAAAANQQFHIKGFSYGSQDAHDTFYLWVSTCGSVALSWPCNTFCTSPVTASVTANVLAV